MYIFKVCSIIAWPIFNQLLFHKILMSTCAQVSKFGNSIKYHKHDKIQLEIHYKCKMVILKFEWNLSTDAEDFYERLQYFIRCTKADILPVMKLWT